MTLKKIIKLYLHLSSHKQILMDFPSKSVDHTQTREYTEYNSTKNGQNNIDYIKVEDKSVQPIFHAHNILWMCLFTFCLKQ